MGDLHAELVATASRHLRDTLALSLEYTPAHAAVVLSDTQCELTDIIAEAYGDILPDATHELFYLVKTPELLAMFDELVAGDLVALVQSTNFRIESFRIRVELMKRGIKVIEHASLARMAPHEMAAYVDSLAYDPTYYRGVGNALKARLDTATRAVVEGAGARLVFDSPFEPAKLNTGDYRHLKTVGGMYPIGEVFTEAQALARVSGTVRLYVFSDLEFCVNTATPPITLVIADGQVVDVHDSVPAFDAVLAQIRHDEGAVMVRELGFGLNRAFSPQRLVGDIGAFERVCGVHLSLGAKHGVFKKPGLRHNETRYHIDVFPVTENVWIDDALVFADGAWQP